MTYSKPVNSLSRKVETMRKAYIVAAKRSAIGTFMGSLTDVEEVIERIGNAQIVYTNKTPLPAEVKAKMNSPISNGSTCIPVEL